MITKINIYKQIYNKQKYFKQINLKNVKNEKRNITRQVKYRYHIPRFVEIKCLMTRSLKGHMTLNHLDAYYQFFYTKFMSFGGRIHLQVFCFAMDNVNAFLLNEMQRVA